MIKKVLGDQLGRNISAYVDDVVVRSKRKEDHIQELRENVREPSPSWLETEPGEVRFRSPKRKIIGMHDNGKGNIGKSGEDRSNQADEATDHQKGGTKVDGQVGFA